MRCRTGFDWRASSELQILPRQAVAGCMDPSNSSIARPRPALSDRQKGSNSMRRRSRYAREPVQIYPRMPGSICATSCSRAKYRSCQPSERSGQHYRPREPDHLEARLPYHRARLKPWGPIFEALLGGKVGFGICAGPKRLVHRITIDRSDVATLQELSFASASHPETTRRKIITRWEAGESSTSIPATTPRWQTSCLATETTSKTCRSTMCSTSQPHISAQASSGFG